MKDIKQKDVKVLWGVLGELGHLLGERELIPTTERTGYYQETTDAIREMHGMIFEEINSRKQRGYE